MDLQKRFVKVNVPRREAKILLSEESRSAKKDL